MMSMYIYKCTIKLHVGNLSVNSKMSHIISNRFNVDVVNKKLDNDDIQEIRVIYSKFWKKINVLISNIRPLCTCSVKSTIIVSIS